MTITITGSNDRPTLTITDTAGAMTEGDGAATLSDSGALSFADVDNGDVVTVSATSNGDIAYSGGTLDPAIAAALVAGFSVGQDSWDYSASVDLDFLAEGETITFSYDVVATDDSGAANAASAPQTVTITITGSNDRPTLTITDTAGAMTEGDGAATLSDSGALSFADVDNGDVVTVSATSNGDIAYSGGTLDPAIAAALVAGFSVGQDSWDYSAGVDLDFLAAGETITFSYDVVATDDSGAANAASAPQTVTITLTGSNDRPTLTITDTAGAMTEGDGAATLTDSGALSFADVDNGDVVTVSATSNEDIAWSGGTLDPAVAAALVAGFSVDQDSWDYSAGVDLDFLAAGETITFSYDVVATDDSGAANAASAPQTVTITITGSNDRPTLTITDTAGAMTEGDGAATLSDSGALSFADVDNGDVVTVSATSNDDIAWSGGTLDPAIAAALVAGFSVDQDSWDYSAGVDLDFLAAGETITFSYDVVATDDSGAANAASAQQTVTITITGSNDRPAITSNGGSASASVSVAENSTSVTTIMATDLDAGATIAYSIVGGADASKFAIDPVTGALSFVTAPDYETNTDTDGNNVYDVVVQASDGALVDTQAIAVTVTNTNEAPAITSNGGGVSASVNVAENTTSVTNVMATDPDAGATITYSIVGGADASKFAIDPVSGALSFVTAPDYETKADTDGNNVYDVVVQASDGTLVDTQAIAVTVTDVVEAAVANIKFVPNTDDFDSGNVNGPVGTFVAYDAAGNVIPGVTFTAAELGGNLVVNANGTLSTSGAASDDTFTITAGGRTETVFFDVGANNNNNTENVGSSTTTDMVIAFGLGGSDNVTGGTNDDALYGGANTDTITGNAGDDYLIGGTNNDRMTGGAGSDYLRGGGGSDTFVLSTASGTDTIVDYFYGAGNNADKDVIDLTSILNVAAGTNVINGGYLRVTTSGEIQVDANGGGNSWVKVGTVNVTGGTYLIQYTSGGSATTVTTTAVAAPIGLDLDGDGRVGFLNADAGVTYDYGAGAVGTAWVGPEDGILILDANDNGTVDDASEFVFADGGTDLEGLAKYDSDGDGQLSETDEAFADLAVWQDSDSDGTVDTGELQSLADVGIAAISLTGSGDNYSAADGDVQVASNGTFTWADGSTGTLADAAFATRSLEMATVAAIAAVVVQASEPAALLVESEPEPVLDATIVLSEPDAIYASAESEVQESAASALLVDGTANVDTVQTQSDLNTVDEAAEDSTFAIQTDETTADVIDPSSLESTTLVFDDAAMMDTLLSMDTYAAPVEPSGEDTAAMVEAIAEIEEQTTIDQLIDAIVGDTITETATNDTSSSDAGLSTLLDQTTSTDTYMMYASVDDTTWDAANLEASSIA